MKLLTKFEKSKAFWFILAISFVFFLLRLPSTIEPNWYGDEGIYQVIGQAMHSGHVLYTQIWDNKPPLLYVTYALFDGDQASIRFSSLIAGILSIIIFFSLSRKLFKKSSSSIVSTSVFAVLLATPFLEGNIANAENFMLLPVIMAALLIYSISEKNKLSTLLPGLLMGIAFLFKIVAIFDLAAFLSFFLIVNLPKKLSRSFLKSAAKTLIPDAGFMIIGFLTPLIITILYFASHGALTDFLQAAFAGNIDYVGLENTFLNIPQGLLILKLALLVIAFLFIFLKRNVLPAPTIFILLWLLFSFFNTFFSQRPYTHYLLVLIPSLSLFSGLIFLTSKTSKRILLGVTLIVILFLVKENFLLYGFKKTFSYYENTILFVSGQRDVKSYQSFFDARTPRDYEVSLFIKTHTAVEEKVFIWGDNAQIYALAHKFPINKYTVAYHVTRNQDALESTQKTLSETMPKYIIILSEAPPIPFMVKDYRLRLVLEGAFIYERSF